MDYTADQLISLCDNKEVVLLDNADLYFTQDLLDYLIGSNKILLCSIKRPYQYRFGVFGKYEVEYENNRVAVRRMNSWNRSPQLFRQL